MLIVLKHCADRLVAVREVVDIEDVQVEAQSLLLLASATPFILPARGSFCQRTGSGSV